MKIHITDYNLDMTIDLGALNECALKTTYDAYNDPCRYNKTKVKKLFKFIINHYYNLDDIEMYFKETNKKLYEIWIDCT